MRNYVLFSVLLILLLSGELYAKKSNDDAALQGKAPKKERKIHFIVGGIAPNYCGFYDRDMKLGFSAGGFIGINWGRFDYLCMVNSTSVIGEKKAEVETPYGYAETVTSMTIQETCLGIRYYLIEQKKSIYVRPYLLASAGVSEVSGVNEHKFKVDSNEQSDFVPCVGGGGGLSLQFLFIDIFVEVAGVVYPLPVKDLGYESNGLFGLENGGSNKGFYPHSFTLRAGAAVRI